MRCGLMASEAKLSEMWPLLEIKARDPGLYGFLSKVSLQRLSIIRDPHMSALDAGKRFAIPMVN